MMNFEFYNRNQTNFLDKVKVSIEKEPSVPMPTKFLYLGWHGAKHWKMVNQNVFRFIKQSPKLLDKYFKIIWNIIKDDNDYNSSFSDDEGIDIVSLGTGLGEDDLRLIHLLQKYSLFPREINWVAIDISGELLLEGSNKIISLLEDNNLAQNNSSSFTALNVDIETSPHEIQPFLNKLPKRKRLFHLLGLTFGNSEEENMIKSINQIMRPGDYLLIDADILPTNTERREKIINDLNDDYQRNLRSTNLWLCNALFFLSDLSHLPETDSVTLKSYYSDQPIRSVKVEYDEIQTKELSKVHEAYSLVRNHIYLDESSKSIGKRRVDYSNKYLCNNLVEFFELNGFELIKNGNMNYFNIPNILTRFFLLRKTKDVKNHLIKSEQIFDKSSIKNDTSDLEQYVKQ